jgi:hyaluronan synthase
MYPATLSHHLRQWVRWMRGSTIRNFWRVRYLSPLTFGWWFTVLSFNGLFLSATLPVVIALTWPVSAHALWWLLLVMTAWGYVFGARGLCVKRSDETWAWVLLSWAAYPVMILWMVAVLRPIQYYGTVTCLKQGWITRVNGSEAGLAAPVLDAA